MATQKTEQPQSSQSASAAEQAQSVRSALRSQAIDRYIIECILDSYLHELAVKDVVACNDLMVRLETEPEFVVASHKSVFDGLMVSTLAATVDDLAFSAALEEIEPAEDPALETLRQSVFDGALECACQSAGGSPAHGKYLRRAQQFKASCGL